MRPGKSAIRKWAIPALALASAVVLPFSGCDGGTSSTGGNPRITLEFRQDGKPVAFQGTMQVVESESNPEFYYDYPDDGTTPPRIFVSSLRGSGPSSTFILGQSELELRWSDLSDAMFPRAKLRLPKTAAGSAPGMRDFNLIFQSSDPKAFPEPVSGWLASVHPDSLGYRLASGDSGNAFVVELEPGHSCSGEVDTASPAGKPLALFVPGSPYYALVHAGRFEFVDLPAGRLPLRWIDAEGRIYAVPESLGLAGDGPTPRDYSLPGPVHAGDRIDSIAMPVPYPVLPPPVADPAGQFSFSDSVTVSLSDDSSGAAIYYTLDGSTPTQDARKYAKPIVLRSSATLKAVAYAPGAEHSPVAVNNYVLAPARPVITPGAGTFVDPVRVEITGPPGSTLRYTLDGATPTEASPKYTGPFTLDSSAVVQAIALVPGLGSSAVVSAQYVIEADTLAPPAHPAP